MGEFLDAHGIHSARNMSTDSIPESVKDLEKHGSQLSMLGPVSTLAQPKPTLIIIIAFRAVTFFTRTHWHVMPCLFLCKLYRVVSRQQLLYKVLSRLVFSCCVMRCRDVCFCVMSSCPVTPDLVIRSCLSYSCSFCRIRCVMRWNHSHSQHEMRSPPT